MQDNLKKTNQIDSKYKKKYCEEFAEEIIQLTKELIYISEIDGEIDPFIGNFADEVNIVNLLEQINLKPNAKFEEIEFEDFFRHPIKMQDWFNKKRRGKTRQFRLLKNYLEENLEDIKVFKIGRVNLEIYIVGLNKESKLMGIKTVATET